MMTEDRTTTLFFEMFSGLPRQGPGDASSTLEALALVPAVGPHTRVLDIGCGTGLQTLVLATHSPARFVGIDSHAPFVDELNRQARAMGIADRLEGRAADMRHLDFPSGSFDVIWSEGAIYVVGFETGLREWRPLLAPGGHLTVTEACWMKPGAPLECMEFWQQEYPAIRDVPTRLRTIGDCGYETVGHFALPASSWWDDYYRPLQHNLDKFRARHRGEEAAQALVDSVQREIDIWHKYSEFYSYEFFVMRAR
jgi:cyclopropane fatty-acyl-phospholipid synthase-like methyltransferase